MGNKNITAAPALKTIPPTSEAFRQNVLRAHFQIAVWKAAPLADPPSCDPTEYGWSRDETSKTLTPETLPPGIDMAPPEVLELLRCGCSSDEPCSTQRCGCQTRHLPCTFYCACRGESRCRNPNNKHASRDADDENDDQCDELDENDMLMD